MIPPLNALPGFHCLPPAGAFYAFPDVSACFRTDDSGEPDGSTRFAERLLEEAQVAVVAGAAFGGDDCIRISFACSRENLRKGLLRIQEFLARG